MIKAEDDVVVNLTTSCTKDEATAKLLGWLQGGVRLQISLVTLYGVSVDQFKHLHSLDGPLQEEIQELRDNARQKFLDSFDSDLDEAEIKARQLAVEELDALANKAAKYASDIDEALHSSDLRIDEQNSKSTGEQYILNSSLDTWAQNKYGISIFDHHYDVKQTNSATKSLSEEEPTADNATGLSATKAENLYVTFALLTQIFSETALNKYKKGNGINVTAIAKQLFNAGREAASGDFRGQSIEGIKDRIEDAQKALQESLPGK